MSKTLYENLLKKFKKANVARRLVIAGEAGYSSPEEYQVFLEGQINTFVTADTPSPKKSKPVSKVIEKPTIYVVDILDCSGSMAGDKISNAVMGVNKGIEALKQETEVNYSYGLCTFSEPSKYKFDHTAPVKSQKPFPQPTYNQLGGSTDLYGAVEKTLRGLFLSIPAGEKVLVNIYTDGGDSKRTFAPSVVAKTIKEAEAKGFTVTFVGVDSDVANIIKVLEIDESNTLAYDGTGAGLAQASATTVTARSVYSKAVLDGEVVTTNFYSKVKL